MSIPCPGCGRGYPEARFAEGRALHCACGARVGRRLETGVSEDKGAPRFFADAMLGRLARWLRALGYDTEWEAEIADAELVRRGVREGRWILTADRGLAEEWWVEGVVLLKPGAPLAQLAEVHRLVGLRRDALFTRCTRCNHPLRPAGEQRREELPPAVGVEGRTVAECPGCSRLYWDGSHTARMRRAMEEIVPG